MKILHVYKDFDPPVHGGMERHIALMCRFQREWATVRALTCSRRLRTVTATRGGTEVREVGEWARFQGAPVSPTFPYHLRAMEADVVVIHVPNPTAELSYLFSRPRGKLVVRYHSDVVRQAAAMRVYRPFLMKLLSKADTILPTSEQYLSTSSALQPFRDKCRVVPLGIVAEEFAPPDSDRIQALRERYGGQFVFFSGRHRYYKGLEYLVRAAEKIDASVVIAGTGPERDRTETLARELGAGVEFVGVLSHEELVAHLHACDVMAFPSVERSEAFGISILEAHVCGTPVVATRLGTGVEFANLHEKTGLNVPPRDAEALAASINELLHNADLRGRLGETARARVCEDFDARRIARAEFEIYQEVVACRKTGI